MKTEQQVESAMDRAREALARPNKCEGMTYAEGVEAALSWVFYTDDGEDPTEDL